jgi:DNA-binding SARP family transcriptional activator
MAKGDESVSDSRGLRIHLFGSFRISVDGSLVDNNRWARKKAKTLVKLLALEPRHQLHREQLMELLWPEMAPESAARNLNKTIHLARHALEPDLKAGVHSRFILTQAQQVILDGSAGLWIDVDRFAHRTTSMESTELFALDESLKLYEGDLLIEDLYEDWATAKREQLRGLYQDTLRRVILLYERDGKLHQSIERLKQLLASDSANEDAHRALMRLYAATGNRHQALRQYRTCCETLDRELDSKPERATIELYEQIEHGEIQTSAAPDPSTDKDVETIGSLAILPLENRSADAELEYLSDGIAESIINSLSSLPRLRVVAWSTVSRYKSRSENPVEVGRALGVRAVLTGRVLNFSERLIIKVELVDAVDGSQLWGRQFNRELEDIFAVETEISHEIAEKLRLRLTGVERLRLAKRYTESTQAYHLYLKGRYYWNRRTSDWMRKGVECFEEAISVDGDYALAYAGLSDSYTVMVIHEALPPVQGFEQAKKAAEEALRIDDELGEAHASLAHAMLHNWEWKESEKEFIRAISRNPMYAPAHHWYSEYLAATGRFDEALAEIEHARQLDPLNLVINAHMAEAMYFARRYDRAIEQLKKTLELDPNFGVARFILANAYVESGLCDQAATELEHARRLLGNTSEGAWMTAYIHARSNRAEEAQQELVALMDETERSYVSPCGIAAIHAALGETNQAFDWLDKAYRERCTALFDLKVDPRFDVLRDDPRFDDLMRRVGFLQ